MPTLEIFKPTTPFIETARRGVAIFKPTTPFIETGRVGPINLSDSAPASDAVTRVVGFSRATADSAVSSDAVARSAGFFARGVSDSASASDSLSASKTFSLFLTDTAAVSGDTVSRFFSGARGAAELAQALDAISRQVVLARLLSDSALVTGDVITGTPIEVIDAPFVPCENSSGVGPAPTPPTVVWVSPTPGQPVFRYTVVTVQALSTSIRRVILVAAYPGRVVDWDVVHDGTRFGPFFAGPANTFAVLAGTGYEFDLLRDGGWPGPPIFAAIVIDTAGQEAV